MAEPQFEIKRAERKQARLRLALAAASNGGKTWSAIVLAFGLVNELIDRGELTGTAEGKIGVVDTERRSSHLYSHLGAYDVVELDPPYTVERYVGAMKALERAGRAVIVLDSISHAWAGQGGVLALLDAYEDRARFSAFGKAVNPAQDEFVDAMLRSPCHVIATMRSKTAWVLEDKQTRSGGTVKAPRRIGMAPVQRPGIEYEFTTLLDLDTDTHFARVVKNRCPVFDNWTPKKLSEEHGRALAGWLLEGAPAPIEVDGSPLERAQAVRDGAVRLMQACKNVPDLGRVAGKAKAQLSEFRETVDQEMLGGLLGDLVLAYQEQMVELGGAPRPRVQELPPPEHEPAPAAEPENTARARANIKAGRSVFDDMADDIPF